MRKWVLMLALLLLAIPCLGEIIIVDDDDPADFNNIQAAIDYSSDWDTIYVFPGTYTGPGNRDIDFLGKAVTVQSVVPEDPYIVAATIIDCDANATNSHRGFLFLNYEDGNSVLNGLTITKGYASNGGGIYCLGSSPVIANCIIRENSAQQDGGGIYCNDGNPIITNCVIRENSASGKGGGLYYEWCGYNRFKGNSGPGITNSEFRGNSGPGITNCDFRGNSADYGGAMYNYYSILKLTSSTLRGNTANVDGGGTYCYGDEMFTNCSFSKNSAINEGGGIFCDYVSEPTLTSCIFWGNADSSGTGESAQIHDDLPEIRFSCIQDDDPNDGYIPFGGEFNSNIDDNPMFVREPNDGGDGWGVGGNDDFGDLHLQNSSPCIDTGDPLLPVTPNSMDIDGQPRVMGEQIDMGADEFFIPVVQMITVNTPQEGDVWVSASLHEIAWDSDVYEGPVDILFSENGSSNWETVESNLPDTGTYTWHLPDIVDSNRCLISVVPSAPDPNVVCIESGLFTIHPDSPGPAVVSKWKSLGGDFKRTGLSENYGPQFGCVKWKFETEGAVSASITVGAGGRVHIACEDGKVYTLDIDDGSVLWSYDTNSPLLSAPTVGPRGSVYVGSENGKLYAISIGGTLRWTHSTGGLIYSSPAVSEDGNVYVCSQDGVLYALGQDGSELWTFKIGGSGIIEGSILASPAIAADGTIYIGGLYDPNLYALDPNNGSVKWVCHFESGGWPFASPVVAADGTIYQTLLYDPNLYAIDRNDGNIIWAADMTDTESGWFEPYYYEDFNFHPAYCRYEGALYHLGDSGWSEPALGPDGTIYVSLEDPYLRAVEPNGTIKWISKPGARSDYTETCGDFGCGWYEKSPGAMGGFTLTVGSDGLIYAGCDDSNLYVVDANGWDVARFDSNDHWLSFPVISEDNTIMVSDSRDNSMLISHPNNVVWAIEGEPEGQELDLYWQGGAQDLDNNGVVDFNDLQILVQDWLKCTDCNNWMVCGVVEGRRRIIEKMFLTGDINRDKYVNFADFALLAERWLSGF